MQEIMLVKLQIQMQEVILKQELILMLKAILDVNQKLDNLHYNKALLMGAFYCIKIACMI